MTISKLKAGWALLTGGITGIVTYLLDLFNTQVLSKITDQTTALMYLKDVQAVTAMVSAILVNHAAKMSEAKQAAGQAVLDALNELAKSLEDFKLEQTELDAIIDKVKKAVEAWKKAK